jgi:acetyl-CoA acetyltransferase
MRDVYVIGAYTTVFKKHPGLSFADLVREAYMGALADAGMNKGTRLVVNNVGGDLAARMSHLVHNLRTC